MDAMMKRILIQLDTDVHPSTFDRIVAVDSGVDDIFSYGDVSVDDVVPLIHGAMFTRAPDELKQTAFFIGGSNVEAGEKLLAKINATFFGPMRVSVMMDSNGSNTTAAAAVQIASKHLDLNGSDVLVLGGTGPVGRRAAQLLADSGARVRIASRALARAEAVCTSIRNLIEGAQVSACEATDDGLAAAVDGVQLIIASGAAGVQFLTVDEWQSIDGLKVAIDLNAVPPVGLEGIEINDDAADHNGITCYGAIGVGGLKMKVHRAAIQRLFESNDQILDTSAVYAIARELG
jgi:methylenetetrahydrofolate/methylenetetrahydromethanopterin dehydrogenase (NADP+)